MTNVYSDKQLKESLLSEKIHNNTVYYTLVQKAQKNWTCFTNWRLLILDTEHRVLYYLKEYPPLPLGDAPYEPNKQVVNLLACEAKRQQDSNEISISSEYSGQKLVWIFTFETAALAAEWIKLIDYQKSLMRTRNPQKQQAEAISNTLRPAILMKDPYKQSIVKDQYRNVALEQSKLLSNSRSKHLQNSQNQSRSKLIEESLKQSFLVQSPNKTNQNKSQNLQKDWNYRFYVERNMQTVYEFQQAAKNAFMAAFQQYCAAVEQIRTYDTNDGMCIIIANVYSRPAKLLHNQFKNYSFIVQATKNQFILGVPLCCWLEYQTVVALIKAKIIPTAQPFSLLTQFPPQLKMLQRYTRVRNRCLQNCKLYDLTQHYDKSRGKRVIYADMMKQYLPQNVKFDEEICLIRPQHMLDNVNQIVVGGTVDPNNKIDIKIAKDISGQVQRNAKQLATTLSKDKLYLTNSQQLIQLFHDHGINLNYLPLIYNHTINPMIRKMLNTTMIIQVVKDYLLRSILKIKHTKGKLPYERIVEDTLRILLDGNCNSGNQVWKEIGMCYKKSYGTPLNHQQILAGFFLNSLVKIFPGSYEPTKILLTKVPFKDSGVIDKGFIVSLHPKILSYNCWSQQNQKLKALSKQPTKDKQICDDIVKQFKLSNTTLPPHHQLNSNYKWIFEYLSLYHPPSSLDPTSSFTHLALFHHVNQQPPSTFTLHITLNYLNWCLKKNNPHEFKQTFEISLAVCDFWLDQLHPARSDMLEILSNYYENIGNNQHMIKAILDSLALCLKFNGQSKQTGLKYYEVAERYVKIGQKNQACRYFAMAKANFETNNTMTNKLGLLLMKSAAMHLSNGQHTLALTQVTQSLKAFQIFEKKSNSIGLYTQPFKSKCYQLLSRIYLILDKRGDHKDCAIQCARQLNNTTNQQVFVQMVKLSLSAIVIRSNIERGNTLLTICDRLVQQKMIDSSKCFDKLKRKAQQDNVMEKLMSRYQHFERGLTDINIGKRSGSQQAAQYLELLQLAIGCVGVDYVIGLIEQKQSD